MDSFGCEWGMGSMSHGVSTQPSHQRGDSSVSGLLTSPLSPVPAQVGLRGIHCTKLIRELSVKNLERYQMSLSCLDTTF